MVTWEEELAEDGACTGGDGGDGRAADVNAPDVQYPAGPGVQVDISDDSGADIEDADDLDWTASADEGDGDEDWLAGTTDVEAPCGPLQPLGHDLQNTPGDDSSDGGQLSQPRVDQRFPGLKPAIAHLISWAASQGFVLVQTSGSDRKGEAVLQCDLGRMARRGKSKSEVPLEQRRQGQSRRFDDRENLCPCRINLRRVKNQGDTYRITSVDLSHNHSMQDKLTMAYLNRRRDQAGPVEELVVDMSKSGIKGMQILRQVRRRFPTVEITLRDIWNFGAKHGVNLADDAEQMVTFLKDKKLQEPGWFYATKTDSHGRLQSVFWMTPGQIEAAQR